jgi:hypothetical protein
MCCEDFPCCGHESGCCPDFSEDGQQLNMRCTCGARIPVDSNVSICRTCLQREDDEFFDDEQDPIEAGYDDDFDDNLNDEDDGYEIYDDSLGYDHGFYGDEC